MSRTILLLVSAIFSLSPLFSQNSLEDFELELNQLSETLLTDSNQVARKTAFSEIENKLKTALALKGAFDYPFDSLQYISIQYPQDSTFRIFSWQLFENRNSYRYGGCIQEKENQQVTFLKDESKNFMDPLFDQTGPEEWFGSVYYRIHDFESERGREYLLFGYNSYQMLEHQKVVDVLSFNSGSPTFGAAAFYQPKAAQAENRRLVFTYSAETAFKLNYDKNLELIIIDHLTPGRSIEGTSVWMADGTYFGYKLDNKRWVYQDKLFHEILEEAPREKQILDDQKGKDIFGNPQRARNKAPVKIGKKKSSSVKLSKNAGAQ